MTYIASSHNGVVARALEEIAGVDCCRKSGIVCCLGMTGNAATVMLCARVCPTLRTRRFGRQDAVVLALDDAIRVKTE